MQHTFLFTRYSHLLRERPLATRSWTSAVVLGIGDVFAQIIENYGQKERSLSPIRSLKMSVVGLTVIGPNGHGYSHCISSSHDFQVLQAEKMFPGASMSTVFKKLALDQIVFAPYIITVNFTAVGLLNGKSMQDIKNKIVQDLTPTFKRDASLWLPANFIGFRFIPYEYRMLYTNLVALVWNTYLSIVNHRKPSMLPNPIPSNASPHTILKTPTPLKHTTTEPSTPITIDFQHSSTCPHAVHIESAIMY